MSNKKAFSFGPIQATLEGKLVRTVAELPDMLVDMSTDFDADSAIATKALWFSTDPAATQTQVINACRAPTIDGALLQFLKTETGLEPVHKAPSVNSLQFALGYPDFRMGELNSADMKIFAKLRLNFVYSLKLYRRKHGSPLQRTTAVFGKWTVGEEYGIFSLEDTIIGRNPELQFDRTALCEDFAREFALRWPLYPAAKFEVLEYIEVQDLMSKLDW